MNVTVGWVELVADVAAEADGPAPVVLAMVDLFGVSRSSLFARLTALGTKLVVAGDVCVLKEKGEVLRDGLVATST